MTPSEKAREIWDAIIAPNPTDPSDGVNPDGALNIIAAALADARKEALEEAAGVAESQADDYKAKNTEAADLLTFCHNIACAAIAVQIRNLATDGEKP